MSYIRPQRNKDLIYKVKLESIKDSTGHYGAIFVFTFQSIDLNKTLRYPINSWLTKNSHPISKLNRACKALMGRDFDIFNEDRSQLIGKECYVQIDADHASKVVEFINVNEYENQMGVTK